MSNDIEFISGLIVKAPHDNAPEYVKAKLSIKVPELRAWLDTRNGEEWVNADIKVSSGGKWYASVDNWKPNGGSARTPAPRQSRPQPAQATDAFDDAGFDDQEIPFCTNRSIY